ncbi:gamma-glutamyl-gamma-aminobutyrate hydrolase [Helicobacter sp. 16-1353]|uniref:gamma-glutamyl-CDP-amidate hydrolase n=1 Tax=Helicobacter sp. 16-1353 TaxID=2004996 RepID=UPI000DCB8B6A|nr:gamma-glutamyl-CDP-amidate hydrolase [Helicobacter sp. 16-1353]RAX51937.1 gamma-glutamyl-gamma-aminobutyrate hydrolase [Helicobacter sp. 16-1353]
MTIGITQRLEKNSSYYEIRECLSLEWGKFLRDIDFIPLSYSIPFKKYQHRIQAVIFSGGNDLYKLNNNELSHIRDNYEKEIIKYCINTNTPLLGICRGAQILSDYFNSTLNPLPNHIAINHDIVLESRIYSVNSYHNFCITRLGSDLLPLAIAKDGSIEAFKHSKLPIFGIMWHIEREKIQTLPSKIIWENFLKEIKI